VVGECLAPIQNVSAFAVGTTLVVNADTLGLRFELGLAAAIVDVISATQPVTTTGSPVAADGCAWYPNNYLKGN
jgi:hypothetical protein